MPLSTSFCFSASDSVKSVVETFALSMKTVRWIESSSRWSWLLARSMKLKSAFGGEIEMRKSDHQLQMPLYMTVWDKAGGKFPYSPENTGMTLAPVAEYPSYVSSTPTSCQMKRPS